MPSFTRRSFLTGGTAGLLSLAGCTALPGFNNPIDMTIINRSNSEILVGVTALRANKSERSEAIELNEQYRVPPATDDGVGVLQKEDVLPSGVYVIQVELGDAFGKQDQYRYYPDCTGGTNSQGDEATEDEFYIDIQANRCKIIFQQNTCSSNSWRL